MQFLLIWFPGREGFLIAFRLFSGAGNREVCYQFSLLHWVLEMESSKFARSPGAANKPITACVA